MEWELETEDTLRRRGLAGELAYESVAAMPVSLEYVWPNGDDDLVRCRRV